MPEVTAPDGELRVKLEPGERVTVIGGDDAVVVESRRKRGHLWILEWKDPDPPIRAVS